MKMEEIDECKSLRKVTYNKKNTRAEDLRTKLKIIKACWWVSTVDAFYYQLHVQILKDMTSLT